MPERSIKRVLDVLLAGCALIAFSPLLLAIAVAIRVTMGSPVFFLQERPGYRACAFTLIKFRTMRSAVGRDGRPVPEHLRITRMGSFLRRTSLDELPECWNILKGEMSLVGPRPLLTEYLPLYSSEQARRHDVKPGLTGWSQVHGRRDVPFMERLTQDVWYVDHRSLRLDAKIILMTIGQVLRGSGSEPSRFLDVSELGFETREPAPELRPATVETEDAW